TPVRWNSHIAISGAEVCQIVRERNLRGQEQRGVYILVTTSKSVLQGWFITLYSDAIVSKLVIGNAGTEGLEDLSCPAKVLVDEIHLRADPRPHAAAV